MTGATSVRTTSAALRTQQVAAFHDALAASLALYAQRDLIVLSALESLSSTLPHTEPVTSDLEISPAVEILSPADSSSAIQRADWFTEQLTQDKLPHSETATKLLRNAQHVKVVPDPKQIVVGIAATSILGPTIGRLPKVTEMTVIITQGHTNPITPATLRHVSEATLGVLAFALTGTTGNLTDLEPELAEWFVNQRELSLFSADQSTIEHIHQEIEAYHIPHTAIRDNDQVAVLALSPVVNKTYQQLRWDLEPLE